MGYAYDMNACAVTNPGATVTQFTSVAGDTLVVRNFQQPGRCVLTNVLRKGAAAGIIRVKSPMMHDEVKGYHTRALAAGADDLFPDYTVQDLRAQDTLIVEGTGGAAETDVAVIGVFYTDLAGISGRFAAPGDIQSRIKNILTAEVAVTTSATIGLWGSALLNSVENLLHANTDYAVLGYELDTTVCAVAIQGIDTGNLKAGGPGTSDRFKTRDYFWRDSAVSGLPTIPIIASPNIGATNILANDSAASTTVNIDLILAELM